MTEAGVAEMLAAWRRRLNAYNFAYLLPPIRITRRNVVRPRLPVALV